MGLEKDLMAGLTEESFKHIMITLMEDIYMPALEQYIDKEITIRIVELKKEIDAIKAGSL